MIDPTTDMGKLRLRVADWQDIAIMPDAVYTQTLSDNNGNLPRAAKVIAMYILGSLASRTHRKLSTIETWGSDYYKQYKDFLMLTFTNPNFFDLSPIPIDMSGPNLHPLLQFQKDWNLNYAGFTESQQLNWNALGSLGGNFDGSWNWPG
jgi:hypothetical protein